MLTNLSLFSGAGGLDLGAKMVGGFKTVAYVEHDRYAQVVLMSRMRDGSLDDAPIFEDVRTFDGRSLAGSIDVVSGGFPCQDLSNANSRGRGLSGEKSRLWWEFARILRQVRPRFALVENVPGLVSSGGVGEVLGAMASLGMDAKWEITTAREYGAPIIRRRCFIISGPAGISGPQENNVPERHSKAYEVFGAKPISWLQVALFGGELDSPFILRSIDGVAFRNDRTRCVGNGVVPQQSAPAWQAIKDMSKPSPSSGEKEGA